MNKEQDFDTAMKYVREYKRFLECIQHIANTDILMSIEELEEFIKSQKFNKV